MGLVVVSNYTNQCYSNEDGQEIFKILNSKLNNEEMVTLSFKGVDGVTSSFVNSALIELLEHHDFDFIKSHLRFAHTSKQINEIINQRFKFEVKKRKETISV